MSGTSSHARSLFLSPFPRTIQAEYFLRQFADHEDVKRKEVASMLKSFCRFDKGKKGYLEEDEAMMMLERRGDPTSFVDLRGKVRDIDLHAKRNLSFCEWVCAVFDKSWIELHTRKEIEVTPEMQAEMDAMKAEVAEAEAEAEAAYARAQVAASKRLLEEAKHAAAKVGVADAQAESDKAHALVESDVARQHGVFAAAAKAAMAARADDAAVKSKMAAFKALDKKNRLTHMTNEERIKLEASKRMKKKAEKAKARMAKKAAKSAKAAQKQAEEEAAAAKAAGEAKAAEEERIRKLAEQAGKLDEEYKKKLAAAKAEKKAKKAETKAARKAARERLKARAKAFESKPDTKATFAKKRHMSVVLGSHAALGLMP